MDLGRGRLVALLVTGALVAAAADYILRRAESVTPGGSEKLWASRQEARAPQAQSRAAGPSAQESLALIRPDHAAQEPRPPERAPQPAAAAPAPVSALKPVKPPRLMPARPIADPFRSSKQKDIEPPQKQASQPAAAPMSAGTRKAEPQGRRGTWRSDGPRAAVGAVLRGGPSPAPSSSGPTSGAAVSSTTSNPGGFVSAGSDQPAAAEGEPPVGAAIGAPGKPTRPNVRGNMRQGGCGGGWRGVNADPCRCSCYDDEAQCIDYETTCVWDNNQLQECGR